jgi:hypothetical protein
MQCSGAHIAGMRLALALCIAAAPAFAQEPAPVPPSEAEEGFSLIQEGAKLVLRGLMNQMEPTLNEMEKALGEVGPALEGLGEEVGPKLRQLIAIIDDFKNYDAPVMLPNGDILIRRNAPLAPQPETVPGPNGEIEL